MRTWTTPVDLARRPAAAPAHRPGPAARARRLLRWEHLCLAGFIALVVFGAARHDYWADELQAWLLARDGSIGWLLGHQLRYEGNPGLWHLLLMGPAQAGLPLVSLGVLAAVLATVGAALFLYLSPFPALVRALYPFTYFALFQYGVVARPYALLAPAAFATAQTWRSRFDRPGRLGLALGLLSLVAVQGMLLAAGVAAAHAVDLRAAWRALDDRARRAQLRTGAALAALWALLVAELLPVRGTLSNNLFPVDTTLRGQMSSIGTVTNGALAGWWWLTLGVVAISVVWCASRRRLGLLALATIPVLLFAALRLHSPWHEGFTVCGWLLVLWVTLDERRAGRTAAEQEPWSQRPIRAGAASRGALPWLPAALHGAIVAVLGVHAYWAGAALAHSADRPYAPAAAAAAYLRDHGLDHAVIYGAVAGGNDFYLASLDAYFGHNVLANYRDGRLPAYYTYRVEDVVADPLPALSAGIPDLLIVTVGHAADVPAGTVRPLERYTPVAYFHGYLSWKDTTIESEDLLLERRTDFDPDLPTVGGCPDHCGTG